MDLNGITCRALNLLDTDPQIYKYCPFTDSTDLLAGQSMSGGGGGVVVGDNTIFAQLCELTVGKGVRWKPEKFSTLTGFESVTSRYRCDHLTDSAMKPLTMGAGHLWVLMGP